MTRRPDPLIVSIIGVLELLDALPSSVDFEFIVIYGDGSGSVSPLAPTTKNNRSHRFSWMQHGRSSVRSPRFRESLSLSKDHINARGHTCSFDDAAMSRENQPDHAPYSVYSHREKWFLVAIISFAGLFRYVAEY